MNPKVIDPENTFYLSAGERIVLVGFRLMNIHQGFTLRVVFIRNSVRHLANCWNPWLTANILTKL